MQPQPHPRTREGKPIMVGRSYYELVTHNGGKSWHVEDAREVVQVIRHAWQYVDEKIFRSTLGDVRTFAVKAAAKAEARRRNKIARAALGAGAGEG